MSILKSLRNIISYRYRSILYNKIAPYFRNTSPKSYGKCGKNVSLNCPLYVKAKNIFLDDYTRLQPGIRMIAANGTLHVKKYSAIGAQCVIIPGGHKPTVGLPQYLSYLHINDKDCDIVVNEDCWIGAGCYLLSHCCIGRGAVVAAGSIVTKPIPPYAVAAGSPCKIIGVRFSIEQIIEHERQLYPENERFKPEELEQLFKDNFEEKRVIGTSDIKPEEKELLTREKNTLGIKTYE